MTRYTMLIDTLIITEIQTRRLYAQTKIGLTSTKNSAGALSQTTSQELKRLYYLLIDQADRYDKRQMEKKGRPECLKTILCENQCGKRNCPSYTVSPMTFHRKLRQL